MRVMVKNKVARFFMDHGVQRTDHNYNIETTTTMHKQLWHTYTTTAHKPLLQHTNNYYNTQTTIQHTNA